MVERLSNFPPNANQGDAQSELTPVITHERVAKKKLVVVGDGCSGKTLLVV
jgi:GTPase SAR1 family protein